METATVASRPIERGGSAAKWALQNGQFVEEMNPANWMRVWATHVWEGLAVRRIHPLYLVCLFHPLEAGVEDVVIVGHSLPDVRDGALVERLVYDVGDLVVRPDVVRVVAESVPGVTRGNFSKDLQQRQWEWCNHVCDSNKMFGMEKKLHHDFVSTMSKELAWIHGYGVYHGHGLHHTRYGVHNRSGVHHCYQELL